ncbi:MAG: TetR/AcrR family transcriptional regulator [Anaerolineales bacterium]|jgi:AcrR family transcriptional regulator
MLIQDWSQLQVHFSQFEQEGLVSRTFRRLDPERQQAVVDAILEEASQKGPTALNIKEVARKAGVSVGSLYQYFGSRDGLMAFAVALCARYMVDLFEMYGHMILDQPLRTALHDYLVGGIDWGKTEAGIVRFFGRAAYQGDPALTDSVVKPVAKVMQDFTVQILTHAAQRGEVRPDADLEAAARVVNAILIAIGDTQLFPYLNEYYRVSDETMPLERVVDAMIDMVQHGIST